MQQEVFRIKNSCINEAENAKTSADITAVKVKYLGKNGEFTGVMKLFKAVPKEEKAAMGKYLNDAKVEAEAAIETFEKVILKREKEQRLITEKIDVTLPETEQKIGSLHPLTIVKNEMLDIFSNLGFAVKEGPEVETDLFNFQYMNIPKDHPARDMQDSFYITDGILLRTHTSPMQARVMQLEQPPIRIVVPGKVYRADDDATHSPMFQQIEGLVIDKHVTLCDLKGLLEEFAKEMFNKSTKVRFRPSYFPFTEPSVEVDLSCTMCGGKGCRLCKGTGWLEVLGAGIVHPRVLEMSGIDPKQYSGLAFGIGVERVTMIKYGIPDMRIFFQNDARFIELYK